MQIDMNDSLYEFVNRGYSATKEIQVHQVSSEKPELEECPGQTIRPGSNLIVDGIGSGDDGCAALVTYFQDDELQTGYVPLHNLIESADCLFTEAL